MKYTALALLGLTILYTAGCKDVESNEPYIKQMEDSLFKAYPTVNRVSIEVKEYSDVFVTLGDAELYQATDEKRQAVANEIGKMTIHFFDANNYLDEGKVIFVKEENTMNTEAGTEKTHDMGLKALKGK